MDYEPKPIQAMAASASGRLLAVARQNGDIEVLEPDEGPEGDQDHH
jgi:hypothetical protein